MSRIVAVLALALACASCASWPPMPAQTARPRVVGNGDHDSEGCAIDPADVCRPDANADAQDGCPPVRRVLVDGSPDYVFPKVLFVPGSAVVRADARAVLDEVASDLRRDPAILLVEVSAFADGTESKAETLSAARARAVVDVLVAAGVAPSRLRAGHYGAFCSKPPKDPSTRDEDRRVEMVVLVLTSGPTGAVPGCEAATRAGVAPRPISPAPP